MTTLALVNGIVLTMDEHRRLISRGTVLIEDEHIAAVGSADEVVVPSNAEIIEAEGHVVMPGLINSHCHVPQILLRGSVASQDRYLFDWLTNVLYPGLNAFSTDDIGPATTLFAVEAIRSGTTCVVDNQDGFVDTFSEAATQSVAAYSKVGLRAIYARMMFDRPLDLGSPVPEVKASERGIVHADFSRPTGQLLNGLEEIMRTHHRSSQGRIHIWPAPAHPSSATDQLIRASQSLARKFDTSWTMHLSNVVTDPPPGEMTTTHRLYENGLLDERLLACHCIGLRDDDVDRLKRAKSRIATQPVANGYLAMGDTPLSLILQDEIAVGIGTDDVNCNESVNLLGDMKALALHTRSRAADPSAISPERIIEMATIEGARAVGLESSIGSLEPGKLADVILVDLRHPQTTPHHHLPTTLVFATYGSEVDTVIINGDIVMRHRALRFVDDHDELTLCKDAITRAETISQRAGLRTTRPWRG
jgi:cytosine/adenosine deaminase-related metal-dependent hydrolase